MKGTRGGCVTVTGQLLWGGDLPVELHSPNLSIDLEWWPSTQARVLHPGSR